MPHDAALVLIDKMPGDVGLIIIELFVSRFDLLFVFLDMFVLIRINEACFKEKIPEFIEVHAVAEV